MDVAVVVCDGDRVVVVAMEIVEVEIANMN